MKSSVKIIGLTLGSFLLTQSEAFAISLLYLNSTRGTGVAGDYREAIADALDDYDGGNVFDVDFIQTHVSGDLATALNAKQYDQIWFDTTIPNQAILNDNDLTALNNWAANNQPEFILDSSFYFRRRGSQALRDSAIAATVNQALALDNAGGGIFIGTDHDRLAHTANQILQNFGFDSLFTGAHIITDNGAFVGDLMLSPEQVNNDFFTNNLQGLSTSNVPIGQHTLNANGGDRTIQIYENLYSLSPERVSHVGASFQTGDRVADITDPDNNIPTPLAGIQALIMGGLGWLRKKKQEKI